MKTEEIIKALREHASEESCNEENCPYFNLMDGPGCHLVLVMDAADRLNEMQERCVRYAEEAMEQKARLARYEDAERDGRLVVLPCKVGGWVYALWDVPAEYRCVIYCAEVKEILHSIRNCRLTTTYRLEPIEFRGRRKEYRDDDFGETVFLTREEAEAALTKEGQNGGQ